MISQQEELENAIKNKFQSIFSTWWRWSKRDASWCFFVFLKHVFHGTVQFLIFRNYYHWWILNSVNWKYKLIQIYQFILQRILFKDIFWSDKSTSYNRWVCMTGGGNISRTLDLPSKNEIWFQKWGFRTFGHVQDMPGHVWDMTRTFPTKLILRTP